MKIGRIMFRRFGHESFVIVEMLISDAPNLLGLSVHLLKWDNRSLVYCVTIIKLSAYLICIEPVKKDG